MLNVDLPNYSNVGGKIRTISTPYGYAVAEGSLAGHDTIRIIGYRPAMSNGTFDDISNITAVTVPIPAAAVGLEVVANAADASPAGAGARTIEVHGLGQNFQYQEEAVVLAGAAAVALVKTYRRINSVHVTSTGSNGVATGPIIVRGTGGGTEYIRVGALTNASTQCHYTIPANKAGYIVGWSAGSTGAKPTRLYIRTTSDNHNHKLLAGVYSVKDIIIADSAFSYKPLPMPIRLPPQCDIKVTGEATGAGASCSASIELWIEDLD